MSSYMFDKWIGYHGVVHHLFQIAPRQVISMDSEEGHIKILVTHGVQFIDRGIARQKNPLSHCQCASVKPNSTHVFTDGTTLTKWPLIQIRSMRTSPQVGCELRHRAQAGMKEKMDEK